MSNILIRGCPGTGKTLMARSVAYYICNENLSIDQAFQQDPCCKQKEIEEFITSSGCCEFIQVHPSMEFDDIVYGIEIKANGALNIEYAEKRIMSLCNRAKGKNEKYCIIIDDINRANVGMLIGNLLYAMEYRNETIELPGGNSMSIPENVILIFTENTLDVDNNLDLAVRRRMTYLKELKSDKSVVENYYRGYISNTSLDTVLDIYDRVRDFIYSYFDNEPGQLPESYLPGHGDYIVELKGTTYFILDSIRQKIRFKICPHLVHLFSLGLIKTNPDSFIRKINDSINVGVAGICRITSIRKKLVKKNEYIANFSLTDSRAYYSDVIVPAQCKDYRGMMECIIDALILNNILPYDVLLSALLTNTSVAYIKSLHAPFDKAAFIVEKNKANRFMYETTRKDNKTHIVRITGTHAYYTLDTATTGRWAEQSDTEEYVVSYNDGRRDVEYIPLSGFRNHGFAPDSVELSVQHNTANIMTVVHVLLSKYLALYHSNIELIIEDNYEYQNLYDLIGLERKYLDGVCDALKRRANKTTKENDTNRLPKGDDERLDFYGKKIRNLRLLWFGAGDYITVNATRFRRLVNGEDSFSLENYENMFEDIVSDSLSIEIKGVVRMTDLTDYQHIMENIGVRQMIFQGPPGTSKTFECKRFVLKQLNPQADVLSKADASQEDISNALDAYKMTDSDYADPCNSKKLKTGGWDLVQFHPSYGYEDFIRGIEVRIQKGSTTPNYESVNRILGKIAEFAKASADDTSRGKAPKFYLIVDEINRANLATVFGELIYGLEYRNSRVSTPYEVENKANGTITKDIVLGKNLFILGTMNTADKSIDSIDYAIRRRFLFVDSPARREVVLNCYRNVSGNDDENSIELLLFDAVQKIFDDERFFNSEYQKNDVRIGHTYFLRNKKNKYADSIIEKFVFQVIPILREYVKDGIIETDEDLIKLEHNVSEIKNADGGENIIKALSENIMLYVKEFGSLNKFNQCIDNEYVGKFIDDLIKEFEF